MKLPKKKKVLMCKKIFAYKCFLGKLLSFFTYSYVFNKRKVFFYIKHS